MFDIDYSEPRSLSEAISQLTAPDARAVLLAGGTDLIVDLRRGKLSPRRVISLWGVPDLRGVRRHDSGAFSIGALTTASEIAEFFAGCPEALGLSEAARLLGSRQIQNAATIGGNICKASPGADFVPPLLCLDARVALSGPRGSREAKVDGFLTGPGQTARDDAEILTSILLPAQHAGTATAFLKVMRRRAEDLSIVSVCALVRVDGSGDRIQHCRIALGAVAPFPFLSLRAEEILTGSRLSAQLLQRAAAAARDEAKPISDIRASIEYRRGMIEVLVRRAVSIATERARGGNESQ